MKFRALAAVAMAGALLAASLAAAPADAARKSGGQYVPDYGGRYCVPGRPGCQGPDRRYDPWGGGFHFWYWNYPPPYYYYPPYPYYYQPYTVQQKMSCSAAKRFLRRQGFTKLSTKDCSGKYYEFTAYKGGRKYSIRLNAYSGRYNWSAVR